MRSWSDDECFREDLRAWETATVRIAPTTTEMTSDDNRASIYGVSATEMRGEEKLLGVQDW